MTSFGEAARQARGAEGAPRATGCHVLVAISCGALVPALGFLSELPLCWEGEKGLLPVPCQPHLAWRGSGTTGGGVLHNCSVASSTMVGQELLFGES